MEEENGPARVIKNLAACNKTIRDRALRLLVKTWLPSQQIVPEEDMKKIWKGLFYCLWHADKFPVQSDLINSLSSLLVSLPPPLSVHYFSSFLVTIRREWPGIDSLRLDKFYLLIRRFMHSLFCLMKKNLWDLELVEKLVCVLEERALFVSDGEKFVMGSNGVNYHLATIFLDEVKPFWPIKLEVIGILFRPFVSVLLKSNDKVLVGKIKSNVFDVLLKMGKSLLEVKKLGGEVSDSDDVVVFGTIGLKMGLSSIFYELGSCPDCVQGNRKVLFGLHEDFSKLEKSFETSGIEIRIPEIMNDDDDEVPTLVPMTVDAKSDVSAVGSGRCEVTSELVNGSADGKKSKKKKVKKGSETNEKKSKKKNKKENVAIVVESALTVMNDGDVSALNIEKSEDEPSSDGVVFTESVISNLQMQFEKVAAEAGLNEDCAGVLDSLEPKANAAVTKKRKRAKSMDGKNCNNVEGDGAAKSRENSGKRVRFSMKNNLVWKPDSPMPHQSLRIPPSVTPRGSALKRGIPPGPIRGVPNGSKRVKRAGLMKKGRKKVKGIKQLKKLKVLSA